VKYSRWFSYVFFKAKGYFQGMDDPVAAEDEAQQLPEG